MVARKSMLWTIGAVGLLLGSVVMAQPLKKSITWEKLNKNAPSLKQIGTLAVRDSREINHSIWSIGCETLDRDYANFEFYKEYVSQTGAKYGRLQSGWAKTEQQKGVYEFAWLDAHVKGLHEQKVAPWICLCYGNPIYGSTIRLGSSLKELVHSEEGFAAWLKYVEQTVKRYKPLVTEWEVWNEPFNQGKDYAVLLLQTAELIKKLQPEAVVLATHMTQKDRVCCLDALKAAEKFDLVDYWVYHPYHYNPDEAFNELKAIDNLIKSYSPKYKVYQGEVGCPSILEWTHAIPNNEWSEYSQAKWNLRSMAGHAVRGIRSSVFTLVDLRYHNMLQSFGLLRADLNHHIIYKRPSFYAIQHMMSFFDSGVVPVGLLTYEAQTQRKMEVAGFQKANTPVVLFWYNDRVPEDTLAWDPIDVTVQGVTFKDPVYVEMLTGRVFELASDSWKRESTGTHFTGLLVWDSPIMVAERAQVPCR